MSEFSSCFKKQEAIKELFADCLDTEAKYHRLIDLGRTQTPLEARYHTPAYKVSGCQSTVYLHCYEKENSLYFSIEADALISAGLAYILSAVYSGESAETILKCPPTYLEELGINIALTPSRANGLYSIHLRMKQEALQWLLKSQSRKTIE